MNSILTAAEVDPVELAVHPSHSLVISCMPVESEEIATLPEAPSAPHRHRGLLNRKAVHHDQVRDDLPPVTFSPAICWDSIKSGGRALDVCDCTWRMSLL